MEQQDARLRRGAALRRDGIEQLGELAPRGRVDGLHVDRIGPPEVVLPGDGVLEGGGQTIHLRHDLLLEAHETSIRREGAMPPHQPSTRMKWNTAFL